MRQGTALYVHGRGRHAHTAWKPTSRRSAAAMRTPTCIYRLARRSSTRRPRASSREEGLCLDVSGGGELACAQAAGFPMERVFVHGNNKTPQRAARRPFSAGVGRIVVDSRIELARVVGDRRSSWASRRTSTCASRRVWRPTRTSTSARAARTRKFGFTMLDDFAFTLRCRRARGPERAPGGSALPHRLADLRAALLPLKRCRSWWSSWRASSEAYGYYASRSSTWAAAWASPTRPTTSLPPSRSSPNAPSTAVRGLLSRLRREAAAPCWWSPGAAWWPTPGVTLVHGGHPEDAAGHPQVRGR